MNKKVTRVFGKNIYLLGADKDGIYYWLEEARWDCDWYWGLGYIETYTNNENPESANDINSHGHWNSMLNHNNIDDFFENRTFDEKEKWSLLELMETAYCLRQYSDMLHVGGSHITNNPMKEELKNNEEYKRINEVLIPRIMNEVYRILSPQKEDK